MNERIKKVRKTKHLSQKDFAKNINISQNHLSAIENGARTATERIINDICKEYHVNKDWLIKNEGEMFIDPLEPYVIEDKEIEEFIKSFLKVDADLQETIKEMVFKIVKK